GNHWQLVGPQEAFNSSGVRVLMFDNSGTLWAIVGGKLLFKLPAESVVHESPFPRGYDANDESNLLVGLAESATGELWFATTKFLYELKKGKVHSPSISRNSGSVLFDKDGSLWFISGDYVRVGQFSVPLGLSSTAPTTISISKYLELLPGREVFTSNTLIQD